MKTLSCNTNKRKFRADKFIVIDVDSGRPMFFNGRMFVYDQKSARSKAPVEIYGRKRASDLIRQSVKYRNQYLNRPDYDHKSNYSLMPVYYRVKNKRVC